MSGIHIKRDEKGEWPPWAGLALEAVLPLLATSQRAAVLNELEFWGENMSTSRERHKIGVWEPVNEVG